MTITQGRGAWTSTGMGSPTTLYRSVTPNPPTVYAVGSQPDKDENYRAVNFGVKALQDRLKGLGFKDATNQPLDVDGWFGVKTKQAVLGFQAVNHLETDGVVGRRTVTAMFRPLLVLAEAAYYVPENLLAGLVLEESGFDVGAVGVEITYGLDLGLVQINMPSHPDISWEQAFNPSFAFTLGAREMRASFNRFHGLYGTVTWDPAVAHHHNPKKAEEWARTGAAPDEEIFSYVANVKTLASGF